MREVYAVKTYDDYSKELETLFFERDIDAFVFLEKHGYEFDMEAENHFTFDRVINGIREWAVVERKSVTPRKPMPFKFGDKIKFKRAAIYSGAFPDSIKEGFTATVMDVEEDNVMLHVGNGLNILRVVPINDMHEGWFEPVSSIDTDKEENREYHIMVDIETLGISTDATIVQIAAVNFNIKTGEVHSTFNEIQDIGEIESMSVEGNTLQWWLETNPKLLSKLITNPTTSNLLKKFHSWLSSQGDKSSRYMWGNGILFDNNIIRHQLGSAGLDYPINYDKDRDVRTILQLAADKLNITVTELKNMTRDHSLVDHDAINDVHNQIYSVVFAYNTIVSSNE